MRRRLKPLKWIALALCLAVIIAYAATTSRCIAWIGRSGAIGLGEGVMWWKTRWLNTPGYPGWHIGQWDNASQSWLFPVSPTSSTYFGLMRSTAYTHELSLRTILVVLVPLTGLLWWSAIRARPPYLCRACRYDLRGVPRTPDGDLTCPECGAAQRDRSPIDRANIRLKPPVETPSAHPPK